MEVEPYASISETVQGIVFNFGVGRILVSVGILLFRFASGTTHILHDAGVELCADFQKR
jgi:hypothetical protein